MEIHQNPLFFHENIFFLIRKSLNTPHSIFRANIRNLLLRAPTHGFILILQRKKTMSTIFVKKCFWHYCLSRYLILKLLEQVWLEGFCQLPSNILFRPPFTNNIWKRKIFCNACKYQSMFFLFVLITNSISL
jgi:hypothetical protein